MNLTRLLAVLLPLIVVSCAPGIQEKYSSWAATSLPNVYTRVEITDYETISDTKSIGISNRTDYPLTVLYTTSDYSLSRSVTVEELAKQGVYIQTAYINPQSIGSFGHVDKNQAVNFWIRPGNWNVNIITREIETL